MNAACRESDQFSLFCKSAAQAKKKGNTKSRRKAWPRVFPGAKAGGQILITFPHGTLLPALDVEAGM
jgi:hypothetical protein